MRPTLEIFLGATRVGTITNLTTDHNVFTFDDDYLSDPSRPVLSSGFNNTKGEIREKLRVPHVRLLPFFANLLPEGHLRAYLAPQAKVNPKRDFPLLWLLGEDLPGAVIARHADDAVLPEDAQGQIVSESIERDPHVLKFSLAGVQLKFSAIREAEGGLTIPVHGKGGTWIAKMPSSTYPYVPENEHTMLSFARHLGIEVPEIGLINAAQIANMPPQVRTDLGNALYIKRFDRSDEQRIHIEDFAQIFGLYPTHREKYDRASVANILEFLWRATSHDQVEEFVRRLVFSIGIGNGDMHVKNWSVIYSDTRTPRLTPAYDYVSTIVYMPDDDVGLSIARTKNYENIDMERMERLARRAGVPRGLVLRATRDMVERINGEWAHLNDDGLLPQRMVEEITAHRDRVPLLRGRAAHPVELELSPKAGATAPADGAPARGAETEIA